ncbi:putative protein [Pseudoclavibacter triregionum]|nr:putative protein [Pseudoclavibacter triregionum]
MSENTEIIAPLPTKECRRLLASQQLGRLIERVGEQLEVFPVSYVLDEERIIFRTAPGTKLAGLIAASEVLFEVDAADEDDGWSVVARVSPRILEREDELARVAELPLRPLAPTVKEVVVELAIDSMTGRRFTPGPEPEAQPETIALRDSSAQEALRGA